MDKNRKPDREPDSKKMPAEENEGEGSKSADRSYRRNVDEFLDHEDPSKLGRDAAADLDRDPEKFRDAERAGKSRIAEEDPEILK